MPCDSCGHPKMAHKETTLAVYFCSQCQQIESHITFSPDRKVEASSSPQSGEDLLSQLYYSQKAFKQSSSTAF